MISINNMSEYHLNLYTFPDSPTNLTNKKKSASPLQVQHFHTSQFHILGPGAVPLRSPCNASAIPTIWVWTGGPWPTACCRWARRPRGPLAPSAWGAFGACPCNLALLASRRKKLGQNEKREWEWHGMAM